MHNLDVYKFIQKINKSKIDKKSLNIVKDLVLDLSKSDENDIIIDIVNLENINRNFFKENKMENKFNEKFCSICQQHIKKGEHKSQLCDCKHIFHKKCLNKYLKIKKIDFECPVCRHSYKNILFKLVDNSCNL